MTEPEPSGNLSLKDEVAPLTFPASFVAFAQMQREIFNDHECSKASQAFAETESIDQNNKHWRVKK